MIVNALQIVKWLKRYCIQLNGRKGIANGEIVYEFNYRQLNDRKCIANSLMVVKLL